MAEIPVSCLKICKMMHTMRARVGLDDKKFEEATIDPLTKLDSSDYCLRRITAPSYLYISFKA